MSTKAPSPVRSSDPKSLEKVAYLSVDAVATQEPNDRYRLGYHVWRWLTQKRGTLEEAVAESGARLSIPASEAVAIIRNSLKTNGFVE